MRSVACLAVLVLSTGAARAETRQAIGLELPWRQLSLWSLGPQSAWGLELGGSVTRSGGTYPAVDEEDRFLRAVDSESRSWRVDIALTWKRFRETGHDVRPFFFVRGHERVLSTTRDHRTQRSWITSACAGLGVEWQPFERVGLWARQGLEISYRGQSDPDRNLDNWILQFARGAPRVLAYFTF